MRLACCGVVGMTMVLGERPAGAEEAFRLGRWSADTELGFEWNDQETRTGGTSSSFDRYRFEERVGLRNSGFSVLDPRIFRGNLSGRFGLYQEQSEIDGDVRSRNGRLVEYLFDGAFLPTSPYTASIFVNRREDNHIREFGGRTDTTYEAAAVTLTLRETSALRDVGFPYFGASLGARREHVEEDTVGLGGALRRDEVRTSVTFDASKGFERADLRTRYVFTDVEDRDSPAGSYQTQEGSLVYSLDVASNARWDSRLEAADRSGATPLTSYRVDESLRIDHHEKLFTHYRYLFARQESRTGDSTTHSGSALVHHRLYDNLTSRVTAGGALEDFGAGKRTSYHGDGDFAYRRSIPRGGVLLAGAGARYEIDDNRFDQPLVDVIDEPHVAPVPLAGNLGFLLDNAFVVEASIVVIDARGGARLPTALGIDYIVLEEGIRTRIIPLATSPVILPGDPLLVSYSFEVAPDAKFSTVTWQARVGVDYRWIGVAGEHESSGQDLLSGEDDRFLDDRRYDAVRLDLRGEWDRASAVASARYEVQDSTRLDYRAWRFSQFLSIRPAVDARLGLTAQESFVDYSLPERRTTDYFVRGTLDWLPRAGLSVGAYAGVRVLDHSDLPTETVRETGARARAVVGRLEVIPRVTWTIRDRGSTETDTLQVEIRAVRRFF